jgi:FtsH-binding integral membrane protein
MDRPDSDFNRLVRTLQWVWLAVAILLVGGIIAWIIHLIRAAWTLGDVPSASIGISIVAIPIFIVLMSVVLYVFLGLRADARER